MVSLDLCLDLFYVALRFGRTKLIMQFGKNCLNHVFLNVFILAPVIYVLRASTKP